MGRPCLLIYKIRYQHIDLFTVFFQVPDKRQYPLKSFPVDPVVTVYNLKISALSGAETCIDGIAVASVLFIDDSDYLRIVFHIFMGDL